MDGAGGGCDLGVAPRGKGGTVAAFPPRNGSGKAAAASRSRSHGVAAGRGHGDAHQRLPPLLGQRGGQVQAEQEGAEGAAAERAGLLPGGRTCHDWGQELGASPVPSVPWDIPVSCRAPGLTLPPPCTQTQKDAGAVEKVMQDLDENGDGEVDFQEYVVLVAALTVACNTFFWENA